jgi:hypothetical protein
MPSWSGSTNAGAAPLHPDFALSAGRRPRDRVKSTPGIDSVKLGPSDERPSSGYGMGNGIPWTAQDRAQPSG